jgi:hypothetical protein
MRKDNYPHPVSDTEAEGLPATADDDSTAYDDVETGRIADGPDPAALPADAPLAVDRFGTTPEEARLGESLDYKLDQYEPDVLDQAAPAGSLDDPGRPVGRLVAPDEGAHADTESDAVAFDAGASGGGASAEELAMHEVTDY